MLAKRVQRSTLEESASAIGVCVDIEERQRGYKVRLLPLVSPDMVTPSGRRRRVNGAPLVAKYQRKSASLYGGERLVNAICWHGFRDFFREVFSREDGAVFYTAFATYRGAEDFEAKYRETGGRNIGSQFYPVCYREACFCDEY